jgi:Spy/CpxP family protein refolding chaperone
MKLSIYSWLGAILLSSFAFATNVKAQNVATPTGNTDQQRPHFIQQLGLSDAQKAQIKQIRQNIPKGKERREQIMAVLTPEQRAQLKQDIAAWKAQHQQP